MGSFIVDFINMPVIRSLAVFGTALGVLVVHAGLRWGFVIGFLLAAIGIFAWPWLAATVAVFLAWLCFCAYVNMRYCITADVRRESQIALESFLALEAGFGIICLLRYVLFPLIQR